MTKPAGRVLIIAGSDSGGGAGIQADIKTVTALGGYAATAVTAITVQNTLGVSDIHSVPTDIIAAQIQSVLSDIGADTIKTGMLANTDVIEAVAIALDEWEGRAPLIVDPVMVAKGGSSLLEDTAIDAMKSHLIARAALVTPNAPEAEALTGLTVQAPADMEAAGHALLAMGAKAALIKGGHLPGDVVCDVLVTPGQPTCVWERPRLHTRHTHGTGCTLASAVAVGVAQGLPLPDAVGRAGDYVSKAIQHAPGFGAGHGPLDHGWPLRAASAALGSDQENTEQDRR